MADFEISQLSDEQLEIFIAMNKIAPEQAENLRQMKMSEAVRGQAGPEGRQTRGAYVAANPLEFIGDFMQKRKAGKKLEGLEQGRQDLLNQRQEGIAAWLRQRGAAQRGGRAQPEGAITFGMEEQVPMGAGQAVPSDLPQAPAPQPPLPQAPQPNIPNQMPPGMGDQMSIGAGGDTSRNINGSIGNASIGQRPPGPSVQGLAPDLWEPDLTKKPKTAIERYIDSLRGGRGVG